MRKIGLLISFFILIIAVPDLAGQELIYNRSITGVCYAGSRINKVYIPPPKSFYALSDAKGGGKITVTYTGFSSEVKAAVDYAVSILESMLPSDLNMNIRASWTKISTEGVLGNSAITGFAPGWSIDALDPMAFYPVTVAEKIAGRSINEDWEADVELVLNSNAKWYFGTDGNTPVTRYDLVTVVIHELCHGLGFFDSMNAENSLGSYGIGTIPIIYDKFVENLIEKRLVDTTQFEQYSGELYNQLTGGQLYFSGPLTRRYLSGVRPRLYAPSTWDPGSSVAHLDELRTGQADALMTPFIDFGEAIHDPGKLTMSILGDMGWINTRIIPGEIKDTEENLTEIEIKATIRSDTTYNRDMVGVVYSFDDFTTADTLMLLAPDLRNSYSGILQIPGYNTRLDYYLFVADDFSRLYRSPSLAEKSPYTLFIGTDTVRPVISHVPAEYYFEKIDSIPFRANVTDNLGVDTVYIEYIINNGSPRFHGFIRGNEDEYTASLAVKSEMLKGGDSIEYRIIAFDSASLSNRAVSPSSDYYRIKIEALLPEVTNYFTDFTDADADFFNSGFEISSPSGFTGYGLHSEHPYKSPDQDDMSLEFSSVLRHPVIVDASGMMISYRELVLVEPGAEGSVYGFSDFYDYVIIEASKDFGKTWFGLSDGYDSRIIPSWEEAYNSSIDGQNSTFAGEESMMLPRVLYPGISDKISIGDTLLIRFRLYSDPYANGWGWVINDLNINPLVDQVKEIEIDDIKVYPNPGDGRINISLTGENNISRVLISAYNFTGRRVLQSEIQAGEKATLDISGNPSGLYLIIVSYGHERKVIKYNLIKR